MAGSKPSLGELVGPTGSRQDARQSCTAEGPTGSIRRETGSSSSGLLQSAVRVWRGPSSTAHPTLTYPVTAAFLWARERRVVRDTSPVTLTSIKGGEEGCSPEKQAWKVQHSRCGWRLPSAGASAQTLQCKASLEGPQGVLEDQSTSGWKFSLSGMVSGLQASVLDSKAINGQATRSPALGHAEKMKNMGQAVCHPRLYALKRGLMLTRVIPPRRPWLLVCVRSPVTPGFATDNFPLLNQRFLEGSPAQPEGTGQALVPAFQAWSTHCQPQAPPEKGSPFSSRPG